MATKDLKYYMGLSYTIELRRDEEGDWIASVKELERCSAHGATQSKALESLDGIKELWLKSLLKAGDEIPEPAEEEASSSGKWLQRTPKSLHRKLAVLAKKEQVSLNQLVTYLLAEAVGARGPKTGTTISGDIKASCIGYSFPSSGNRPYTFASARGSLFVASTSDEIFLTRNSQEFAEALYQDLSVPRIFPSKEGSAHGTAAKNLEYVH